MSDGLPGHIVALALPLDVDKVCNARLTAPGWQQHPCEDLQLSNCAHMHAGASSV